MQRADDHSDQRQRGRAAHLPPAGRALLVLGVAGALVAAGACGVRRNVLENGDGSALAPLARWTSAVALP